MKKAALLLSIVLSGFSVASAMAAEKPSDAELLKSYKSSFINSCVESSGGDQFKTTCECVLNELVKKFSVRELQDSKLTADYIENVAMKKCDQ